MKESILMVFAMDQRTYRIKVSDEVENVLTAEKLTRIG